MTVAVIEGLSTAEAILIVGVVGILLDRIADSRGWSRSSKTLRAENVDLLRRNTELEQTVQRHERTIAGHQSTIARLETKVADLELRDQRAVLAALEMHESNAERRNAEVAARHTEALMVFTEIRDELRRR